MDKAKVVFMHMMMISTGILFLVAIEGLIFHFYGKNIQLDWFDPLSFLGSGFLCALISLLVYDYGEMPKKKLIRRIILHCLIMFVVVIGTGFVCDWYENVPEFLFVAIGYFVIYILVWAATTWFCSQEAKKITKALDSIRETE